MNKTDRKEKTKLTKNNEVATVVNAKINTWENIFDTLCQSNTAGATRAKTTQAHSSANTSINSKKLPAVYNKINWRKIKERWKLANSSTILRNEIEGKAEEKPKLIDIGYIPQNMAEASRPKVLDYGAGKYTEHIKKFCDEQGFEYVKYDKFNGSDEGWDSCKPAVIICSNVLNVIDSEEEINRIHQWIVDQKVPYFITIYAGNKTGVGCESKTDCFQRNQTLSWYQKDKEIIYRSVITCSEYRWCMDEDEDQLT